MIKSSRCGKMNKYTVQICLTQKDIEFLNEQSAKHGLKNNSQVIRTIIMRYKGMEDYIVEHKKALQEVKDYKASIPIRDKEINTLPKIRPTCQ